MESITAKDFLKELEAHFNEHNIHEIEIGALSIWDKTRTDMRHCPAGTEPVWVRQPGGGYVKECRPV